MLFKDISIIDENLNIKNNMYVGVAEGKIEYVGEEKPQKKVKSK